AAASEAGRMAWGKVDCYLLGRLTGGGVHATDRTNASRTMLFDIHRLAWDQELSDRLGIPGSLLPDVLPSSAPFGSTDPDLFLGIRAPVAGVAGAQPAALFGRACL